MGPTGAGKTDLALRLAERLPIEIVSVDSAMVYRGMNIGTGKPPPEALRRHPHHLVDILDPSESYSAGQFVRDACQAIDEIRGRGNLPLLVGGTMLYFRALRRGLAELPQADPQVRGEIDAEAARRGWSALHADLAAIDPAAAARIQPRDAQRIQRALEVYRLTGATLTQLHASAAGPRPDLSFLAYAWAPADRTRLYAGIERRLREMLRAGFLDEVRALYARGDLHARLPAIRSVGYRQLWEHLTGEAPLEVAVERAVFATRQLARRQLVWLRSDSEVRWVDALEAEAYAHMERSLTTLVC
ncbi:MAG TPA: tRNA (adenosine(37)-N6)-dimethylallyltransferase MiaA [Steroidobacter sp.]|jgi:tRNA dimethylallyltransferase|nr:tRNA (adenosine(37)-N6)-dimethylallyltransferase MiaA [Steroidobacteraceae bacterium]HLS81999.1 tRNA (adenosine(37)-N6)-dimethylallyltransferase MiaA [Steroidobacter sp.]